MSQANCNKAIPTRLDDAVSRLQIWIWVWLCPTPLPVSPVLHSLFSNVDSHMAERRSFGLSYSTWQLSNASISPSTVRSDTPLTSKLTVSFSVSNLGAISAWKQRTPSATVGQVRQLFRRHVHAARTAVASG